MENQLASAAHPTRPNGSLTSYAPANVRAALRERMIFSQAIELVGAMLKSYPPSEGIDQSGYIGTLAAALMEYPPCVARKCGDPIRGVTRSTRFKPTVADVIAWCEREIAELREITAREDRTKAHLEQRHRDAQADAELAAERAKRPTIDQLRAKFGPNWGLRQADDGTSVTRSTGEPISAQERAVTERSILAEYARRGLEPVRTWDGLLVSPALLVALGRIPEREAAE